MTIYHGYSDFFQTRLALNVRNVLPGGGYFYYTNSLNGNNPNTGNTPYFNNCQKIHNYSRVYHFYEYPDLSSPEPSNRATIIALKNKSITWNPGWTDREGDSISVKPELIKIADSTLTGSQFACFYNGAPNVSGYVDTSTRSIIENNLNNAMPILYQPGHSPAQPFGLGSSYTLNPMNGEITFTPQDTGMYLIAYRIEEYRNKVLLGDIMQYRMVFVKDSNATLPVVSTPYNISGAAFNTATQTFTLCGGNTLSFNVKCTSTLPDAQLQVITNFAQALPGATYTISGGGTDSAVISFSYSPQPGTHGYYNIYTGATDTACGPNHYPVQVSRGFRMVVGYEEIKGGHSPACKGDTMRLHASFAGSHTWTVLGGDPQLSCGTCDTVTVSPDSTTTYLLQTKYGPCAFTDTFTVLVIPPFTVAGQDASFPGAVPASYTLNTTVVPAGGYYNYVWTPASKVDDSISINPKPLGVGNTEHYVITVADTSGCYSVTDTVTVLQNTSSVQTLSGVDAALDIHPNPAKSLVKIIVSGVSPQTIGMLSVRDLQGRLVDTLYEGKAVNMPRIYDVSRLEGGVYIIHWQTAGGQVNLKRQLITY